MIELLLFVALFTCGALAALVVDVVEARRHR